MRKSSHTDASLLGKQSVERNQDPPKLLAETIRFPNTSGMNAELSSIEHSLMRDKPVDSIRRFSEMYQWLKEHLQESSFEEQEVLFSDIGHKVDFRFS